jgi:5-hydroxyisourate hydrolase
MSVSLSTHVLDTEHGRPAEGVRVELFRGSERVAGSETGADGRIPALAEELEPGRYRLAFHPPSSYLHRVELELELEEGHHHVPLLVSSYACTTYRGS